MDRGTPKRLWRSTTWLMSTTHKAGLSRQNRFSSPSWQGGKDSRSFSSLHPEESKALALYTSDWIGLLMQQC